jgi:hypothetical protein
MGINKQMNIMKNEKLNQSELKEMHDAGKVILFAFRTIFDIKYNENTRQFGLCKITRKPTGLPYTSRGRFVALDANDAHNLIHA